MKTQEQPVQGLGGEKSEHQLSSFAWRFGQSTKVFMPQSESSPAEEPDGLWLGRRDFQQRELTESKQQCKAQSGRRGGMEMGHVCRAGALATALLGA